MTVAQDRSVRRSIQGGRVSISAHVALKAGEVISGYEIWRVLGGGGFGIVYEGYNHGLGRRAAIKEFFPHGMVSRSGDTVVITDERDKALYERVLRRFEESTRVLARLNHSGILKVYGYEGRGGTAYMIMEYVEGETLREWTRSQAAAPSEAELRQIFLPIADALAYVHERGVLHRDISPDNIMLEKGTNRPVLIDFGALRQEISEASNRFSSVIVARESYAPPEQLRRTDIPQGPWTDVYALAATMYEVAAGSAPAPSGDRAATILAGGRDPYLELARSLPSRLPPRVAHAIDRALRLAAGERAQSVAAFLADLGWRSPAAVLDGTMPPEGVTRPIASPPRADALQAAIAPTPPGAMPPPKLALVSSSANEPASRNAGAPLAGGSDRAPPTVPPLPPMRRRRILYGILSVLAPVALGLAVAVQFAPERIRLPTAVPQASPAKSGGQAEGRRREELEAAERQQMAEREAERRRLSEDTLRKEALERRREAEEALRRTQTQIEGLQPFTISRDSDLNGDVIDIHFSLDLSACRIRCESVAACVAFTLGPQGTCHTYRSISRRRPLIGYIAGERPPAGGRP